jgi:hypothetical protein
MYICTYGNFEEFVWAGLNKKTSFVQKASENFDFLEQSPPDDLDIFWSLKIKNHGR